jgi:predicted transcriptional regulator
MDSDITLGDRELDVMAVLWTLGSGTVNEVRDQLPASLAYTTVLTILRNLEAKGYVRHEEEGKAHRYIPRVQQQRARRGAIDRLIDKLFAGSTEELLAHLVEHKRVSAAEIERLRGKLDAERKRRPR